jgi:hypothetical protein
VTARGHKGTGGQVCASGGRWHTRAHALTYTHQSAIAHSLRNCHGTFRPVTRRWGCFSGRCPGVTAEGGDDQVVSTQPESGLGAGDITALGNAGNDQPFQSVGTATYLLVGLCLSQRGRAAGSERALVPVACTVALGHALEQRLRTDCETFWPYRVSTADRLPRSPERPYHPYRTARGHIAPLWGNSGGKSGGRSAAGPRQVGLYRLGLGEAR